MWRSRTATPWMPGVFVGGRAARSARTAPRRPAVGGAAFASLCAGRRQPMLEDTRAAAQGCRAHDEGAEACAAHSRSGMALVLSGAGDEGPRTLRAAVAMAGYGAAPRARRCSGAGRSGAALPARGAHRAGVDRASARFGARPRHRRAHSRHCSTRSARDAATTDRWHEARASYHEAPNWLITTASRARNAPRSPGLACLEAREGREDSCREHAASALALAREYGHGIYETWALAALGDSSSRSGRPAEAIERLERPERDARAARHRRRRPLAAPELAEALVQCGRGDEADGSDGRLPPARSRQGTAVGARALGPREGTRRRRRGVRGVVRGGAALARGDARHVRAGAQRAGIRGAPATHAAARRRAPALRAAFAGVPPARAEPWAERARLELAATGETTRKRDPSTLDQLTPRELQIALDLAAGLTTARPRPSST